MIPVRDVLLLPLTAFPHACVQHGGCRSPHWFRQMADVMSRTVTSYVHDAETSRRASLIAPHKSTRATLRACEARRQYKVSRAATPDEVCVRVTCGCNAKSEDTTVRGPCFSASSSGALSTTCPGVRRHCTRRVMSVRRSSERCRCVAIHGVQRQPDKGPSAMLKHQIVVDGPAIKCSRSRDTSVTRKERPARETLCTAAMRLPMAPLPHHHPSKHNKDAGDRRPAGSLTYILRHCIPG